MEPINNKEKKVYKINGKERKAAKITAEIYSNNKSKDLKKNSKIWKKFKKGVSPHLFSDKLLSKNKKISKNSGFFISNLLLLISNSIKNLKIRNIKKREKQGPYGPFEMAPRSPLLFIFYGGVKNE